MSEGWDKPRPIEVLADVDKTLEEICFIAKGFSVSTGGRSQKKFSRIYDLAAEARVKLATLDAAKETI